MINKLEFNNLVITNKKNIQRVKAQTIQKLIQKIKKINYFLEKKPDHERNKERLAKATLSLEELKKLKCVDLMKEVLLLDKTPSAILTNGLSVPEEIAVAMVAENKILQDILKSFQLKLGLTEENKSWKNELTQPSKRRIKIIRTERKRKNRQELKEQKVMARKRMEWLKNQNVTQHIDNVDDGNMERGFGENDEGANISTLGYWKIEPIDINSPKASIKEKTKRERLPKVKVAVENKPNARTNSENDFKSTKTVQLKPRKTELCTSDIETIPKLNSAPYNSIATGFEIDLKEKNSVDEISEQITHVIDPFFITDTGENYRSTAVVIRNGKVLDSQTNKSNEEDTFNKNAYTTLKDNYNTHTKPYLSKGSKGMQNKNLYKTLEASKSVDLHPSWAAKQKLKPVISSFQGKKIKFDDGDNFGKTEDRMKNYPISNKNIKLEAKDKNSLHPSWAAKQKLKATITDFKGKKKTFGDEDEEESTLVKKLVSPKKNAINLNATDAIHPSWAAKQKQKPAITAFQGKKITFADDE